MANIFNFNFISSLVYLNKNDNEYSDITMQTSVKSLLFQNVCEVFSDSLLKWSEKGDFEENLLPWLELI